MTNTGAFLNKKKKILMLIVFNAIKENQPTLAPLLNIHIYKTPISVRQKKTKISLKTANAVLKRPESVEYFCDQHKILAK